MEHVWDINHILPEKFTLGLLLKAIPGYNANPSLIEVIAYPLYLALALGSYFRPITMKNEMKATTRVKVMDDKVR